MKKMSSTTCSDVLVPRSTLTAGTMRSKCRLYSSTESERIELGYITNLLCWISPVRTEWLIMTKSS